MTTTNETPRLRLALEMASHGLPVFPLRPGSKKPFAGEGVTIATCDPDQICEWFAERPAMNYGLCTTDFVVLDVDTKHGQPGMRSLEALGALPATLQVGTPSGGLHLFFGLFDAGQSDLAAGINVRSRNGYVVGAGSELDGRHGDEPGAYVVTNAAEIAPLPQHIAQRLRPAGQSKAATGVTLGELDRPESIARAIAYLETLDGTRQGGRDNDGYRRACRLKDYGLSADTIADLLEAHWNPKNAPPLSRWELDKIARNASAHGQNPAGVLDAANDFEAIPDDALPAPVAATQAVEPFSLRAAIANGTAERWTGKRPETPRFVLEGYVPEGCVTLLVAAGGRGKSYLAQMLMTAVAAGSPLLGLDTMQGAALGLFCEDDEAELHRRQLAVCEGLGVAFDEVASRLRPISLVGEDVALFRKDDLTPLLAELERGIQATPGVKLVVLDSVSFLFQGTDYDRGQVTRFVAALHGVAARHGLAVLLLHHESKTTASTDTHAAAGSTAWLNACRSVLKLDRPATPKGSDVAPPPAERVLKHIKCNKGPLMADLLLRHDGKVFATLGADAKRDRECVAAAVRLVAEGRALGVNLSPNGRAGKNYGPRWLQANQVDTDYTAEEFERALKAALGGVVLLETYMPKNKGEPAQRYALADQPEMTCHDERTKFLGSDTPGPEFAASC